MKGRRLHSLHKVSQSKTMRREGKRRLQYPGGPAAESKYCGDESTRDGDGAFFCSLASSSSFFSSPDTSVSFCFLRIWKYDDTRQMNRDGMIAFPKCIHTTRPTPHSRLKKSGYCKTSVADMKWPNYLNSAWNNAGAEHISVHTSSNTTFWTVLEWRQALATKCSSPAHIPKIVCCCQSMTCHFLIID